MFCTTVTLQYPAGLLHNTATGRWHPIYFRLAPRPSDTEDGQAMRFKSGGHHTQGFLCCEQALEYMACQPSWKDTGLVWERDGTGIPTITTDFAVDDLLLQTQEGGS